MLKALFKKFVGDKVEGDLREIQPNVDAVLGLEGEFAQLQDNDLRGAHFGAEGPNCVARCVTRR